MEETDNLLINSNEIFESQRGININLNFGDFDIKFFFFGCWNKNIDMTQQIINKINSDNTILFGIVNGDNFYPNKYTDADNNTIKEFNLDKIELGFNVLKNYNKNIYVSLGNHEVDNPIRCATLITEINNSRDTKINMPTNYYSLSITNNRGDNMKIIIVDTNLFEKNFCYNENIRNSTKIEMLKWINRIIIETPVNIPLIIVGHYPLFYLKKKKDKPEKFILNEDTFELYNIIIASNRKIYYLASDIHNYQEIQHKNIHEFIAGTGGADLDDIENRYRRSEYNIDDNIFSIIETTKNYGYIKLELCNCKRNILNNFVKIESSVNDFKLDSGIIESKVGGSYKIKYDKYIYKINKINKLFM